MVDLRIRHMVIFCLKYEATANETEKFLLDGQAILSAIPEVQKFEVMRQISATNDYHFGFSMEFLNQAAYNAYSQHPSHVDFVERRWKTEVTRFLEIDFQQLW